MIDPAQPDYRDTPGSDRRPGFEYAPDDPHAPPCVTVVTPFHNAGEVFHQTARCVLGQSLQSWEWLIVNDGTTSPAALGLLEQYRHRDPRIRVIDLDTNVGPSAARNTGVRAARTDYVFFVDDDDLIEPTTLEKLFWFLRSHPQCGFADAWSVGFGARQYLWPLGFSHNQQFLSENATTIMVMVRKQVYQAAGGFDETIQRGMEDWDLWLRCAAAGHWGATIPEYFGWYRRRPDHGDRWADMAGEQRRQAFREQLKQRYPRLLESGFPKIDLQQHQGFVPVPDRLPADNCLRKSKPRLLMILPWLTLGGAEKFNLDLLAQLTRRGWEVSIATTQVGDHCWMPRFARCTPDIFLLSNFLQPADQPLFLRYLIDSRRVDCVLISASELGYMLLPYLRAYCDRPVYIDYSHMEDETWKSGSFPRFAVGAQPQLDLNLVASEHLKDWMVRRGAEADRIEVAYINVDPQQWKPCAPARAELRQSHGLPEDRAVILYAGRLCDQKQPRVFAGVMQELVRQGLDFCALVAGDGPDRGWLQELIDRHQLGQTVRLLGPQPPEQMQRLMAASDIFFLPSRWEGIALTIYEAMASGLAVVGADVGGQRELVTPGCGRLVARADEPAQIQRYTQELAELISNPAARTEMGRNARTRIEQHFTLDQMGQRMSALLAAARRLKQTAPRATVSPGLARELATQAVEYNRTANRMEDLWQDHQKVQQAYAEMSRALAVEGESLARVVAYVQRIRVRWWWRLGLRLARLIGKGKTLDPPQF